MALSRRSLLAAALSLPALRAGAASALDADVVVMGAGAAGLAAAKELIRLRRKVVVIEARDRIGGRAHTDLSLGAPFDAGAQYIHWGERNPWREIARELGEPIQDDASSSGGGPPLVFRNGARLTDEERARRRGSFGRVWSRLTLEGGRDRSFAEAVRGAEEELVSAAASITRLSLGEDPERVSLADYQELWAGDDYILPQGYGRLVERYGAGLPVRLGTPAALVRWGGRGVEVETPAGTIRAGAAVVTVPVGVLQAGALRFQPELPAAAREALGGLRMGAYTKIALKIDRARLGALEATDFFEVGDDGAMASFEFWPFGRDLAIAYLGGDHARRLCEAGEPAAVAYATERLALLAGGRVREAVTGGRLAGWWSDPFSRGSYSIALPGRAGARLALREPVGGKVWIAGEATAGGGAMTVGGATLEGTRAGREAARIGRA